MINSAFSARVIEEVRKHLPEEYREAEFRIEEIVKKQDQLLTGLVIRQPGERAAPVIYLDSHYRKYLAGETSIEEIGKDIASLRLDARMAIPDPGRFMETIGSYDAMKGMLAIQACDPEVNREWLAGRPFTMSGTLAATYTLVVNDTTNIPVTNSVMNQWGVGVEQVHADAMDADRARGYALRSIQEMLEGIMDPGSQMPDYLDAVDGAGRPVQLNDEMNLYVLTHSDRSDHLGASVLFFPDILEKASSHLGDYAVLPSSTHEILLLKIGNNTPPLDALEGLVQTVNREEVDPKDFLSDRPLVYDSSEKRLMTVPEYSLQKGKAEPEKTPGMVP